MTTEPSHSSKSVSAQFDPYAGDYDLALRRGLALSGESSGYFAHGRVAWLAARLAELGEHPGSILDFGCGVGASVPGHEEVIEVAAEASGRLALLISQLAFV